MTEIPPPDTLQPGDIQYPYVDPIWNDDQVEVPPPPDYVPPFEPAPETPPEPAPPPPEPEGSPESEG